MRDNVSSVYLGLGSNIGDRAYNIRAAIGLLKKHNIEVNKVSSIIETAPVGGPPQGHFLNGVAKVTTDHDPETLLEIIHQIEKDLGRIRTIVNGPRTIDIDILLFDDIEMNTKELTIPHPRMYKRSFVMIPLSEIAPHRTLKNSHAIH